MVEISTCKDMDLRVTNQLFFRRQRQRSIAGIFIIFVSDMSLWRVLLSILFPPLAVMDKGCGSILIVLILTLLGWIPGVIAALIILNNKK